jgi:predicted DNA repair protein MutK
MLKKGSSFYKQLLRKVGEKLLAAAPYLMRILTILGTAAMFVVGGSIIGHGIPALHHWTEQTAEHLATIPAIGGIISTITPMLIDALFGLLVGAICVVLFEIANKLRPRKH